MNPKLPSEPPTSKRLWASDASGRKALPPAPPSIHRLNRSASIPRPDTSSAAPRSKQTRGKRDVRMNRRPRPIGAPEMAERRQTNTRPTRRAWSPSTSAMLAKKIGCQRSDPIWIPLEVRNAAADSATPTRKSRAPGASKSISGASKRIKRRCRQPSAKVLSLEVPIRCL